MKADAAPGDGPVWRMERRGGVAVLTMPNWALYDTKWDWHGWLDAEIDRLVAERVPALVVDLRGNEGGLDCGDALVERLIARPTPATDARRLVRYRKVPAGMLAKLDTWDHRSDDWGDAAQPFDRRFFQLTGPDQGVRTLTPRGRRYEGAVRVLTDPQNSSATHQFAQIVRREGLAKLIGETTGGNCRGINGGYFYTLTLPASRVEVDVPLIGQFPSRPQPDAGVVPDILVAATREDIVRATDQAMLRALS
jgi:C-terminal processing protease CtpA/Prc